MPFFGKSKKKEDSYSEKSTKAYPTQPAYPTQSAAEPTVPMSQPPQQHYSQPGYPQGPPPPYYQPPAYQQMGRQPQGYAAPPQGYGAPPQGYGPPPPQQAYPQQAYSQPRQPQTVVVQGGFDAGARFGPGGASVPPPPPGCAPNAAQVAMAQGNNVVVTQRPSDFMTGGSDGGYVIW